MGVLLEKNVPSWSELGGSDAPFGADHLSLIAGFIHCHWQVTVSETSMISNEVVTLEVKSTVPFCCPPGEVVMCTRNL